MSDVRWAMSDGRWTMGDGRWAMELKADHLCHNFSVFQGQSRDAWFLVDASRRGGDGVQHEAASGMLDERFVRVAEDNYIRFVAGEQLAGRGTAKLVTVADVDGAALDVKVDRRGETLLSSRITVSVYRLDRSN